jgi:hypothetical protein
VPATVTVAEPEAPPVGAVIAVGFTSYVQAVVVSVLPDWVTVKVDEPPSQFTVTWPVLESVLGFATIESPKAAVSAPVLLDSVIQEASDCAVQPQPPEVLATLMLEGPPLFDALTDVDDNE